MGGAGRDGRSFSGTNGRLVVFGRCHTCVRHTPGSPVSGSTGSVTSIQGFDLSPSCRAKPSGAE
ncbi:hypothetical protein STAL104432_05020 [Streptomyces albus]